MIIHGDALEHLKQIGENTIDLIVTDPPYGIEFMGKDWDRAIPSQEVWQECFRVLKYGKIAFVMCSPRQDVLSRMILSLDMAGFKTGYTSIYWSYASGFPKAKNNKDGSYVGFQPKPAVEVILVVSKGKTLTWLDDCRIPYQSEYDSRDRSIQANDYIGSNNHLKHEGYLDYRLYPNQKGRFPANLLVSDDVLNDGKNYKNSTGGNSAAIVNKDNMFAAHDGFKLNTKSNGVKCGYGDSGSYSRYFDLDKWYSSKTFPFIITPKASKSERNEGCEDLPLKIGSHYNESGRRYGGGNRENWKDPYKKPLFQNNHPTVKPIKLMSYLITLGSRENDLVLDPFCGSGTTLIAAEQLRRKWLGIEINAEYIAITKERLLEETNQWKMDIFV